MEFDTRECENKLGTDFKDKEILRQAFIHRSYLNENQQERLHHNERLEYLGDAVMELIVTDFLFHKYPEKPEGELTSLRSALVNTNTISDAATRLSMNDFLLLSRGEAKDTGRARQYILANTFEAVIGAIYLDRGYAGAKIFLEKNLLPKTDEILEKRLWQDAKSYFQEKAQESFGQTPIYKVMSEVGPDHNKVFRVGVFVGEEKFAEGEGHSKQEAEQEAASMGLEARGWR